MATAKYLRLSAYGVALIPGTGSAMRRCDSYSSWVDVRRKDTKCCQWNGVVNGLRKNSRMRKSRASHWFLPSQRASITDITRLPNLFSPLWCVLVMIHW